MNARHLRERIAELDSEIDSETDPSCTVRLIRERLDLLNVLLSLEDEEKANTV